MKLGDFLEMYKGSACITVNQLPYCGCRYSSIYVEEEYLEDIEHTAIYDSIKEKEVDSFYIIGGGIYKIELSIDVK